MPNNQRLAKAPEYQRLTKNDHFLHKLLVFNDL